MLPEHSKFIHTCQLNISDMLTYQTDDKFIERDVKAKLFDSLVQELAKHVSFHEMIDPKMYDKIIRGSVVIMPVEEYKKILDRRYVVNPPPTVVKVPYQSFDEVDAGEAVKQASEIIDNAVKSSKSLTDFLSNRVTQLQNEHLLPKRKP
jgi:hypothetical protein